MATGVTSSLKERLKKSEGSDEEEEGDSAETIPLSGMMMKHERQHHSAHSACAPSLQLLSALNL